MKIDYNKIPTLAQCHYCEKEDLVQYYNYISKFWSYHWVWTEIYQILRDRMWEEDLMCSLLPSRIKGYKLGFKGQEIYF